MSAAARNRPRTSRPTKYPPPLEGRELDAADVRFVTSIVRRTSAAAMIGYEDALSAGLIAYWLAARRFDESRGLPWHVFAAASIGHGIQDEARSADHLSRCHRRAVKAGDAAGLWVMAPHSLDEPMEHGDGTTTLGGTIAAAEDDHDLRLTVDAALELIHLAHPRVAAVLRLYYEQGWRDQDIAVLLAVSESRVSQMRTEGRGLLAALLPRELLDAA